MFPWIQRTLEQPRSKVTHLNKTVLCNQHDFIPATHRRQFGYIWLDSKDWQEPLRYPGFSLSGTFQVLGSPAHFI